MSKEQLTEGTSKNKRHPWRSQIKAEVEQAGFDPKRRTTGFPLGKEMSADTIPWDGDGDWPSTPSKPPRGFE